MFRSFPHDQRSASRSSVLRLAVAAGVATALLASSMAAASPSESTDGADSSSGTRIIETEFGPVEIPADVERITSVDFYTPAALVDVGVVPVGVVESYSYLDATSMPQRYLDAVADVPSIGEYYEIHAEAVLATDPDVILATDDFLDEQLQAQLEEIAPVVVFTARSTVGGWRTRTLGAAEVAGKLDEARALEAEYDALLVEARAANADILENYTIAVFSADETEWGTFGPAHFLNGVWADLGAQFWDEPEAVTPEGFPTWFSYEELDRLAEVDIIFWVNEDPTVKLADNVLWQNLPAVQNGLVFENIERPIVSSFTWASENVAATAALLDEVRAVLDAA